MRTHMKATASAALLGLGWVLGSGTSQAATLSGDRFDISYYYPTRTTLYADLGTFTDPARVAAPQDPKGLGRLDASTIIYNFGVDNHFTAAPFDGVVFTDETANRIGNVGLSWSSDVTGLSRADLTFTSNSISLNLSDVTVHAGSRIQISIATRNIVTKAFAESAIVAPVPLPSAAPMFGAAVMGLAGFGYGMNRRATRKAKRSQGA